MHRLFVALRLPVTLRGCLLEVAETITGARWVTMEDLHLTLRFIGEVDRHQAEDIAASLLDVRAAPIALLVDGVGTFETRNKPNSLWASVQRSPALVDLQQGVGRALLRAGVAAETRAFRPHITVARLPRSAGPIGEWLATHAGLRCTPAVADRMELVESQLGHTGASYSIAASYPLVRNS